MFKIFFENFYCIFVVLNTSDMNIGLFSKIIKEMLACNRRAAIPNFGTFVVNEMPATFSDKGFTVNPPYYRVDFISSVEDDGEFAGIYSKYNNIDRQRAERLLAQFLADLKSELFSMGNVTMPGLGRLKVTAGNFLVFVQDEDLRIIPELDCLLPVSLKSLSPSAPSPVEIKPAETETAMPKSKEPEPAAPVDTKLSEERRTEKKTERTSAWLVALIVLVVIVLIALAVLAILGRLYPDLVDPYLYDESQLRLLKAAI